MPSLKGNKMNDFIRSIENAFDDLGHNNDNMLRSRPYDGQPHTCKGVRGAEEVKGVTFRDIRDCYIRGIIACCGEQSPALYEEYLKGENALLSESYLYKIDWEQIDPMAAWQNMSCEIEKIMGIYPNIKERLSEK